MPTPDQIADALIALINSSPRSPRKEQIIEAIAALDAEQPVNVIVMGCQLGATITVTQDSRLEIAGWHTASPIGFGATPDEITMAILDYLKAALRTGKAKANTLN